MRVLHVNSSHTHSGSSSSAVTTVQERLSHIGALSDLVTLQVWDIHNEMGLAAIWMNLFSFAWEYSFRVVLMDIWRFSKKQPLAKLQRIYVASEMWRSTKWERKCDKFHCTAFWNMTWMQGFYRDQTKARKWQGQSGDERSFILTCPRNVSRLESISVQIRLYLGNNLLSQHVKWRWGGTFLTELVTQAAAEPRILHKVYTSFIISGYYSEH